ncbi:EF-hand calcium-binding domain-containing protein 4B isoform X1 [Phlebotomus argentipes]|uniref:EF-hand calcium-binding domain-containing protein 4B isoform X1 n=1 Tax=Phlebotomus argentipes TaxID=94469 RepID=UPI0028936E84|nr:EF-hand calcium-binding domain-containing protein 4B isoform X1 [Phlebotomus argentipes]
MDAEVKIVEESLGETSSQVKIRNPFKSLRLRKKEATSEEGAKPLKKSKKISRNFALRSGLGRRRKIADKQSTEGSRQTPEGGNPLTDVTSLSDASAEIETQKAPEVPISTASSERIEFLDDEKPHRATVADRVSVFQQHSKKSTSTIRSRIAKRFHVSEANCMQESEESSKEAAEEPKREPVNFAVGSAVTTPPNLAHLRHITSLESDSEEQSEENFLQQPKSRSPSGASLRRIAYEPQASQDADTEPEMPAHGDLIADNVGTNMTPSGQTNAGKKEHLYKILVIGELGTGKTSFIKRYVHQFFSNNYRATIGVDFALKVIPWDENTIVRLQLWDIAGQERFGNMTRVYYKEAVGAFIVFDVTRSATFDAVAKWKQDLDAKVQLPDGSNIPCVLLANKCDQEKQGFVCNSAKMDEYVRENKFTAWFETSAKENINIEESAKALVTKILINDKTIVADPADEEKVLLTNSTHSASKSCAC